MAAEGGKKFFPLLRKFGREGEEGEIALSGEEEEDTQKTKKEKGKILTARTEEKAETREKVFPSKKGRRRTGRN